MKEFIDDSCLPIVGGGGGIPVIKKGSSFEGINCVVDKDHVASLLAKSIGASVLLILTDVDKVKLNYGKSNESDLDIMTVKTAKRLLKEGQFLEGSMKPKIQAQIDFLESGGEIGIITSLDSATSCIKCQSWYNYYKKLSFVNIKFLKSLSKTNMVAIIAPMLESIPLDLPT